MTMTGSRVPIQQLASQVYLYSAADPDLARRNRALRAVARWHRPRHEGERAAAVPALEAAAREYGLPLHTATP